MLFEYAVEPQTIARSWDACRYLSEKFGFDRARILALYPSKWLPMAIGATAHLPDAEKKRVVEMLITLKRRASVKSGRAYNPALNDWLQNAVAQQGTEPFHAIIASSNPNAREFIVVADEADETHPLMAVSHDLEVSRDATAIARAMGLMLRASRVVMFVDPFYDPFNGRYQRTLRECLNVVHAANLGATCEIHHLDKPGSPPAAAIEREARRLFERVIPNGMIVTIYRWRERDGGADFHARYLLTDRGGIRIDAGFSAEGDHQKTDMTLMALALSQQKRSALNRDSQVYDLVQPVLQIASSGYVEHV